MKAKLMSVESPGVLDQERIVIRALSDIDIGNYAVLGCDKSSTDGRPLPGNIDIAYWFNFHQIKAKDLVILYTKSGRRSEKALADGRKSHFFYWGRDKPIWRSTNMAVLVEGPAWDFIEEDDATREPTSVPDSGGTDSRNST